MAHKGVWSSKVRCSKCGKWFANWRVLFEQDACFDN